MFSTSILALSLAVGGEPLPQSTLPAPLASIGCNCGCAVTGVCKCPDCPGGVAVRLVAAPVVIAEPLPTTTLVEQLDPRTTEARIEALEARVVALEARLHMPYTAPLKPMPVTEGYQKTQTATASYAATSSTAGSCADGSCGPQGRQRARLFGRRR